MGLQLTLRSDSGRLPTALGEVAERLNAPVSKDAPPALTATQSGFDSSRLCREGASGCVPSCVVYRSALFRLRHGSHKCERGVLTHGLACFARVQADPIQCGSMVRPAESSSYRYGRTRSAAYFAKSISSSSSIVGGRSRYSAIFLARSGSSPISPMARLHLRQSKSRNRPLTWWWSRASRRSLPDLPHIAHVPVLCSSLIRDCAIFPNLATARSTTFRCPALFVFAMARRYRLRIAQSRFPKRPAATFRRA